MFSRKILSLCIALFWLCAAVPQMAFAEYPEHPVTVYHPFEPTPYDALSKVYNAEMSKILGVPFVFEYGMMGKAAKATLNGKPDGYTVYFASMVPRTGPSGCSTSCTSSLARSLIRCVMPIWRELGALVIPIRALPGWAFA